MVWADRARVSRAEPIGPGALAGEAWRCGHRDVPSACVAPSRRLAPARGHSGGVRLRQKHGNRRLPSPSLPSGTTVPIPLGRP